MSTRQQIEESIANGVRAVFDLPARFNPASFTENALGIYFRFAAVVSESEDRFAAETAKLASHLRYAWGRFAEGYYRDHPDASDASVRKFVLAQFQVLAEALQMSLPEKPVGLSGLCAATAVPSMVARTSPENGEETDDIDLAAMWVRESLLQACTSPASRKSAYDLEDDVCALFSCWGILVGESEEVAQRIGEIKRAHGSNTTLTEQFFFERPWATQEEATQVVCHAFEPIWRAILARPLSER